MQRDIEAAECRHSSEENKNHRDLLSSHSQGQHTHSPVLLQCNFSMKAAWLGTVKQSSISSSFIKMFLLMETCICHE